MRRLLLASCGLIAFLYLVPTIWSEKPIKHSPAEVVQTDSAAPVPASAAPDTGSTDYTTVTVSVDGKPTEMPLESYVEGVVAAEISNDFPPEAIRAQAVAARTYAVSKISRGRPEAHPDADVCDDFHHCAAYRDVAVETAAGSDLSRVRQAVRDTAGEIMTYDGEPIVALFHCVSGPRTEAAVDVWGEDIPYLQSVVSPGGSACDAYEASVTLSAADFLQKAHETFPAADITGAPDNWFKATERSDAGGVRTIKLGDATVEGTAVRALFGLNSTNFTITTTADSITFHTIGYGHGVGLSQYGAKYMAEQGAGYEDILTHYYKGAVLTAL